MPASDRRGLRRADVRPEGEFPLDAREAGVFRELHRGDPDLCAACGAPWGFAYNDGPNMNVMVGTLDDPETAGPNQGHFAVESRVSWAPICDGAPEARLDEALDSRVHQPGYRALQSEEGRR